MSVTNTVMNQPQKLLKAVEVLPIIDFASIPIDPSRPLAPSEWVRIFPKSSDQFS